MSDDDAMNVDDFNLGEIQLKSLLNLVIEGMSVGFTKEFNPILNEIRECRFMFLRHDCANKDCESLKYDVLGRMRSISKSITNVRELLDKIQKDIDSFVVVKSGVMGAIFGKIQKDIDSFEIEE